ncbi:MAG: aldehyde dehydrogenase family protein [Woeseiaceae bacterium]
MPGIPEFATVDPYDGMTGKNPGVLQNLAAWEWTDAGGAYEDIVDPMNGEVFLKIPDTREHGPYIEGLRSCPKSGVHNPLKNPDRYVYLGAVCARAAAMLAEPHIEDYFTKLTQRVMPKSWEQCRGEVVVTRVFLENLAGDGVRFLARGFSNPGNHNGQESRGYRWPYGPVVIIAPFNFPLEIPALQLMGALAMGNRPLIKPESKVSAVLEQFVRLLIAAGLKPDDLDMIQCRGAVMGDLIDAAKDRIRLIQFTGSSGVAEHLSAVMNGAVRIEDAGFDWKVIGPDYHDDWLDYVAWQCDEDAYNAAGQKCSAQSIIFAHENWTDALLPKIRDLASRRSLADLSLGPVLTWTNEQIDEHIGKILAIPGAELLFGGKPLEGHTIPDCYGAMEATAVSVPIDEAAGAHFDLVTTELFGPFQVIISWTDDDLPKVLDILERMSHHLTAAVVSKDIAFQNAVLGATVNGTTYCGIRARTTGAPQNHWFGPGGDPRGAGIGTLEAIQITWSHHREVIVDQGPMPDGWQVPPLT